MQKEQSAAWGILRVSHRRTLAFVEYHISQAGGGRVSIPNDLFEMVGSRRVYLTALTLLNAAGFLKVTRLPKCHVCERSSAWQQVSAPEASKIAADLARQPQRIIGMAVDKPTQRVSS